MLEMTATSTFAATISELGDKTQLLTFVLATRFQNKLALVFGILFATLANHWLAGWFGISLSHWLNPNYIQPIISASFVALGLWMLIPDKADTENKFFYKFGAFTATFILFFLAEMGDKTQIATMLLTAQFENIYWIVLGTTLGMMIANVPVIYLAHFSLEKLPLSLINKIAASLFILLGTLGILHLL